ncbi:MAG: ABC transporter permease, partial [Faecalibacterium sp.]
MFAKLALRNVRRQISNYLIYFVTVALSIALMFAVNNLSYSDLFRRLSEQYDDVSNLFTMVTILSCLVTALVLSYATGFMLKLRKKEFGMYLTLGMTRRNIQMLFACETGILSVLAMLVGMGAGLVIFQLVVALFASIMELPFAISAYSAEGILLTLAVSLGMFLLSTLVSLRYLKKATMAELLKAEA